MKFCSFTLLLLLIASFANAQIVVTKDVDYIEGSNYKNGRDLLDIYMPQSKKNVPVIVYFHGGALTMGDKSWGEDIGTKLAKTGIGMVSVNYRLSPEFQHPSHVNDAAAATAWVLKKIDEYGGDPQKVYVGGHSAGAYLAALLAIDSSLLKIHEIEYNMLKGAVLISPFLYVEETAKNRIELDSTYQPWGDDPLSWRRASVKPHILPNRDNILLIYADGDDAWRKEQNERFASAMLAAGNDRIFTEEVPNRTHSTLLSAILESYDKIVDLLHDFVMKEY